MEKDREYRQVNRLMRSAQAYVSWGLLGVIFPLFGIVFGILAVNKTRVIEDDYDIDEIREAKIRDIRTQGYIIIIFSFVCLLVWYFVLYNHHCKGYTYPNR